MGASGLSLPPRAPPSVRPQDVSWAAPVIDGESAPPLMTSTVTQPTLVSGPEPPTEGGACAVDTGIDRSTRLKMVRRIETRGPPPNKKHKGKGNRQENLKEFSSVFPVISEQGERRVNPPFYASLI